ncbi:MAG: SAM-dependent chlorinase/fluorinase, partial [Elusimicrobia bacterium]|nr:SAM-dependent chlorinase/fluorinase [Elusimicrobiota bacterium]
VSHRGSDLGPLRTHYASVPAGRALALTGSSGYVELSVRDGDFARLAGAAAGDPVEARR